MSLTKSGGLSKLSGVRDFGYPLGYTAFVYVFEGDAQCGDTALPRHNLAVLGIGDTVELTAGGDGARFILVAGRPIGEPVVQYGPFVMNTRAEIIQAFEDFEAGKLGTVPADHIGNA